MSMEIAFDNSGDDVEQRGMNTVILSDPMSAAAEVLPLRTRMRICAPPCVTTREHVDGHHATRASMRLRSIDFSIHLPTLDPTGDAILMTEDVAIVMTVTM